MRRWLPLLLLCVSCSWLFTIAPDQLTSAGKPFKAMVPVFLCFDEGFPENEQAVVRRAAAYWNQAAGRKLFVFELGEGEMVMIISSWDSPEDKNRVEGMKHPTEIAVTRTDELAETKDGLFSVSASITLYRAWFYQNEVAQESVVRHELGHILAFDDGHDPQCLMNYLSLPSDKPRELCWGEREMLKKLYP